MASYTCLVVWLFLLVQRGTGDQSQFHVSSERFGCEMVNSVHPCPATVLNPDLAVGYETDADMVNITLDDVRMDNASQECISALTTTYCSSLTPRCFVNGSRDYGDARMECWKANKTCPFDTLAEGLCESLQVGRQPLSACVKPSKPINGSCPQPKLKMPEDKLNLYIISSVEYENIGYFENLTTARFPNGSRMFSDYCVSKITELYCLPFYCSADEQQIIVEYTYQGCEDIVDKCFDTAIYELYEGPLKEAIYELLERYIDNCVFYPDDSMGSGTPPGDITTPTYENVSSTPHGKNVSTTPQQGTPTTTQPKIPSTTPLENTTSTTPQQKIPSTTPLENATSTTPKRKIPSTTPLENATSTTPKRKTPSTTPLENATSTTPGHNISSQPPETATSEPNKDTKISTPSRKSEPSLPVLITPSPTAGNDRCQTLSYWLLLLFLLALLM